MKYQVTAHLFFDKQDEAQDFFHDCEVAFPKSVIINPGKVNEERGAVTYCETRHDELNGKPCVLIDSLPRL